MFVLAALLSLAPVPVTYAARPFCGGLSVPGPVHADRLGAVAAPVVGCATRVKVECSPEVVARPARPWLVSGDALMLDLSPAAVSGETSCTVHSDQGDATVTVWIPA